MFSKQNSGARRDAPATHRNRDAIWDVLQDQLPATGHVIEVAAGTGQHVAHFAQQRAGLTWWPVEPDPESCASIRAWTEDLETVQPPMALDMRDQGWWQQSEWSDGVTALYTANMTHISPWTATEGLLAGAAEVVQRGGKLIIYGPFRRLNEKMAASNQAFDYNLRDRNEQWGVRAVENLDAVAQRHGWRQLEIKPMPANNLTLIWTI